jgi:hypothetical protein
VVTAANWNEDQDNFDAIYSALVGDGQATSEVIHRHKSGTLANIPAPGNAGRLYRTTDEGEITLIDNGTVWVPNGVQVLDRDITEVEVDDDPAAGAETTIYSHTIPAIPGQDTGVMGDSGGFRLTLGGDCLKNTTGTIVLRVKLGATTVFTSGTPTITNTTERYKWWWQIVCMNRVVAQSQKWMTELHGVADPQNFDWRIGDSNFTFHGVGFNSSTEDTDGALLLDVTVDWSASSASLKWRKEMATLELLPGA